MSVYNTATGDLLSTATVPAGTGATQSNGFRFVAVTPFFAPVNSTLSIVGYQISATDRYGDGPGAIYPAPLGTDFAFVDSSFTFFNDSDTAADKTTGIPNGSTGNTELFSAGNITYEVGNVVPEPTSTLAVIGLGAAGLLRRGRKS